jgi:hypothetical protein
MAQVLAGGDAIPDNLLARETAFSARDQTASSPIRIVKTPPAPGISAISPRSVEKVVRSACAIPRGPQEQRHCVQYSISIRGVLCMAAVQFSADLKGARQRAAVYPGHSPLIPFLIAARCSGRKIRS